MTKDALSQAQFFYTTWADAQLIAEKRDPARRNADDVANSCDAIAQQCVRAFVHLTERHPICVQSVIELSTVNPAEWTREIR